MFLKKKEMLAHNVKTMTTLILHLHWDPLNSPVLLQQIYPEWPEASPCRPREKWCQKHSEITFHETALLNLYATVQTNSSLSQVKRQLGLIACGLTSPYKFATGLSDPPQQRRWGRKWSCTWSWNNLHIAFAACCASSVSNQAAQLCTKNKSPRGLATVYDFERRKGFW